MIYKKDIYISLKKFDFQANLKNFISILVTKIHLAAFSIFINLTKIKIPNSVIKIDIMLLIDANH